MFAFGEERVCVDRRGGRGSSRVGRFNTLVLGRGGGGCGVHLLAVVNRVRKRRAMSGGAGTAGCRRLLPRLTRTRRDSRMRKILVLLGALNKSIRTKLTVTRVVTSLKGPAISLILNKDRSVNNPLTISTSCSFVMPAKAVIIRPIHSGNAFVNIARDLEGVRHARSEVTEFVTTRSGVARGHLISLVLGPARLMGSMKALLRKRRTMERKVVSRIKNVRRTFGGLCRLVSRGQRGPSRVWV